MIGRVVRFGGKAALAYARHALRRRRTESAIVLGLLGAAVTAPCAVTASHRNRAMRGKVVVITGGSRGLGLEIARAFGRHGAHLVLASRNADELQSALGFLEKEQAIANGSTALTVVCDVTEPEQCTRLFQQAIQRYGRVDVLVNNAGIIDIAPFQDQPLRTFEDSMRTNFFGSLHTIQAVLSHMQKRGDGAIVNIASVGGKIGVPHMLPYVASKHALVGFSAGLRAELSGTGVSVTTVCPGLMRTGSHGHAKFGGNADAEYRWFSLGATMPGISASARSAARKIYNATVDRRAEVTITPQAWLASRVVGLVPGFSADVAGLLNRLLLPAPSGNMQAVSGSELKQPSSAPLRVWSEHLETIHNETAR